MTRMAEPTDDDQDQEYEGFADFIDFRLMVVPRLIQVLFWLSVVVFLIGGVAEIVFGVREGDTRGCLTGIATLVLGPLFARMVAEVTILFFRINETLTEIKNLLERSS
jgi:hypothetical protein